jgi:hypothetical protein
VKKKDGREHRLYHRATAHAIAEPPKPNEKRLMSNFNGFWTEPCLNCPAAFNHFS